MLALQNIARDKQKSLLVSGAASVEITGKSCSPYTTHWTDDTYALANATAKAVTKGEGETWYFLTADYSFGHDLERDASNTIRALGSKVLGSSRHPLSTQDFSAYLLQAQSSKAKIVGLASAGADTVNAIKQAKEYRIDDSGQRLAALHAFITDVNSIGLPTAQGLIITSGFYWDATDGTRTWARRFMAEHGRMPTREQAGVYVSVLHYLKAVQAAGKADAAAINAAMRKMPVDRFGSTASVRADGRVVYDIGVYQVKTPAESAAPWDYYRRIASVSGADAFRPIARRRMRHRPAGQPVVGADPRYDRREPAQTGLARRAGHPAGALEGVGGGAARGAGRCDAAQRGEPGGGRARRRDRRRAAAAALHLGLPRRHRRPSTPPTS